MTHDGRAKVTDFGIARALSESGVTESETVWGSPLYFSPEQAAGEPPSPASDVYSIGVVMYEMLAGEPPFQAENPTALALMHMREEPPPLAVRNPHVPSQLEWIVRKVLAKEPSARYRTAEQLALVLEEYRKQAEQMTGWQPAVPSVPPVAQPPVEYVPEPEPPLPPASKALPAWLDWVLGGIAFVAVLGLIPLWLSVYRAYSVRPSLPPTPTPLPLVTLPPDVPTVSVPRLVGVPVEEARALVERAGLRFVVQEERDDPGARPGVVLEQNPAPDQAAPVDSDVSVVVNRPPRELKMPAVVNYPVEIVRDGLESDGLQVKIDEVWSEQPVGMVLAQEPERGVMIYAGDTVTLTVSGGVDVSIPIEANLAELVMLQSAELRQETFRPGEVIAVTLRWRALRAIGETHYIVFVHLIDPDASPQDSLVAQQDIEPVPPTTAWRLDAEVVDAHQVTIPTGLRAGRYELRVGMYPRGQPGFRLPVVDAGVTTAELDSILIAEIEVRP